MTPGSLRWALITAFIALFLCVVVSPLLAPYGSYVSLDGSPGIMDHWGIWSSEWTLSSLFYAVGDMLCHQTADRSLFLNGSQMPLCVRDVFALLGIVLGLCMSIAVDDRVFFSKRFTMFVIICFALVAVDVLAQNLMLLNVFVTRAITGCLAGIAVGLLMEKGVLLMAYGSGSD